MQELEALQLQGLAVRDDSRSGVGGRWMVTIAARPYIQQPYSPSRLPEPEEAARAPRERVRRRLADTVSAVTRLDVPGLRGWHCVLTGGVLPGLSRSGPGR